MTGGCIFTLVVKVTQSCNLACPYCYSSCRASPVMSDTVLAQTMRAAGRLEASRVHVVWHGGEPLLAGQGFYERACALQAEVFEATGIRFSNALQTNATLLTPAWARFFADHGFDVGISLDPPHGSDLAPRRPTKRGTPSEAQALRGLAALRAEGLEPGIIAVVDPLAPPEASAFLGWARGLGLRHLSLNAEFSGRVKPSGARWQRFIASFRTAMRAPGYDGPRVADPRVRHDPGLFDACHPGWMCTETIHVVSETGQIHFGCDRFLDPAHGSDSPYALGHVANGFARARDTARYAALRDTAHGLRADCETGCALSAACDGGCVADWMLNKTRAAQRPDTVHCAGMATYCEETPECPRTA